jgi:glutamate/tyrosine decarboxylase-like PLP-dependent enzyme
VAAGLEQTALAWVLEALDLPRDAGSAFVTGATLANFTGLAAARGRAAIRISVSNATTREVDVDRSLDAILRIVEAELRSQA